MSSVKEILTQALGLTEKEFSTLADYAYCDQFVPSQMSVAQWQSRMKEAMMEEEQMEQELGESLWNPGDKRILMNILYRQPK
jgi:hypothetical protein